MHVRGRANWQQVELIRTHDQHDAISLALGQAAGSTQVWQLRVYVVTDEGMFLLGELATVPPSAGDPPSRVVAIASLPGVRRWIVAARSLTAGEADLNLSDGASPGASGLFPIINGQISMLGPPVSGGRFVVPVAPAAPAAPPGPFAPSRTGVLFKAERANTELIYAFPPGIANGIELSPGEPLTLPVRDATQVQWICNLGVQAVRWLGV